MIAETKSRPLPNGHMPVLDVYLRNRVTFPYVQLFADKGFTHGCATALFCPADVVTHGQAAVFPSRELMLR